MKFGATLIIIGYLFLISGWLLIIILKELMDDESISEETRILYEKACVLLEIEIDSLLGG